MLQRSPTGFIEPCLPSSDDRPPSGPDWVHEIKHDGYRLMARRDPVGIRLLTRNGYDWAPRYPLIAEAVNALKVRSCLIDGEAVACDDNGLAVFELLREKPAGRHVFLYAFDLLELNGKDLRREPFEVRKATLASLLRSCPPGVRLNEHLTHDGEVVLPTHLQAGPRRHRVEAAGLDLSQRQVQGLAEVQEPSGAGGEARGGRGMGSLDMGGGQAREA
jgi:bifunctional non-homologous end joining protein LigD